MIYQLPVAVLAAGIISGYELWQTGDMQQIAQACNAIEYSFVFSILAIFILMQWLKKWSFFPFVIYRVMLGTLLLLDAYGIYDIKDLFFNN